MVGVRHLLLKVEAWVSSWEVCYFNACPHSDRSKKACMCKRDRNIAHYVFDQQMFNIDIEEKPGLSSFTFDLRGPGSGDSATGLISTE